ncbi:hypothetical protein U27_05900 [Candidatus Vecturithrix granuli]|uniref:Uncharacterized protein n=1 Tax=Vecturithrix granuli TaxID=1499967 RepID=A0A081C2X0_VECG1|nr:hypothetical protein U27_05900 [Candidatus Vecturithrix granuli]
MSGLVAARPLCPVKQGVILWAGLSVLKKIEVALADQFFRMVDAKPLGLRLIDLNKPALAVFEVNAVRNVRHKGIKNILLPRNFGHE